MIIGTTDKKSYHKNRRIVTNVESNRLLLEEGLCCTTNQIILWRKSIGPVVATLVHGTLGQWRGLVHTLMRAFNVFHNLASFYQKVPKKRIGHKYL